MKARSVRTPPLSLPEIRKLSHALGTDGAPALVLQVLLHTGIDAQDAARLRAADVLPGYSLRITRSGGFDVQLPAFVHSALLARAAGLPPGAPLFVDLKPSRFRNVFQNTIRLRLRETAVRSLGRRIVPRDLQDSFACYALAQKRDPDLIARQLGIGRKAFRIRFGTPDDPLVS